MKRSFTLTIRFTLFTAALGAVTAAQAQSYAPVAVTGFNQDVVANATGTTLASTTYDVDGSNGAGYNFMAPGFVTPSGAAPTRFLPATGIVTSALTTGLTYQLASYSANNSLRLPLTGLGTAASGTLTFSTPRTASVVYVLATSGGGISNVTPTITFTDGTTQVFGSLLVQDWFDGSSPAATGLGRVSRNTASTIENLTTNPRLYQLQLAVSAANYTKPIQSITFSKAASSTSGAANIMAISVAATPLAVRNGLPQVSMQAYPNPATDALTLQVDDVQRNATAQLLDLTGRELQNIAVHNQQAVFPLSDLAAGVYMVRYRNDSGSKTIKVVKE